jgi:hypothetical protein
VRGIHLVAGLGIGRRYTSMMTISPFSLSCVLYCYPVDGECPALFCLVYVWFLARMISEVRSTAYEICDLFHGCADVPSFLLWIFFPVR